MDKSDKQVLQRNLSQFLLSDVFNLISEDEVLTMKSKTEWFIGTRKLDKSEIETVKSEAKVLEKMYLWKLLNDRKKKLAQDKIVNKAQGDEDLIACRMILYLLDVDESLIEKISE